MARPRQLVIAVAMLAFCAALCGKSVGQRQTVKEPLEKVQTVKINETDSALRKLLKERFNAAAEEVRAIEPIYLSGRLSLSDVNEAVTRFAKAGAEMAETPAERIKYREITLEVARTIEAIVEAKYKEGDQPMQAVLCAKGLRLDAEIELLREREAAKTTPKAK